MTCLAAWRGKTSTVIGCDSEWSAGSARGHIKGPKFWRNGNYVIAMSGTVRGMQLIQYGPQFNGQTPEAEIIPYLVREWVPLVFNHINEAGNLKKDEAKTAITEVQGLIVSRRKLIRFGSDFSIIEEPLRYIAEGCGEEIALGYMAGIVDVGLGYLPPECIIEGALKAATKHCSGVSGPYFFEELK